MPAAVADIFERDVALHNTPGITLPRGVQYWICVAIEQDVAGPVGSSSFTRISTRTGMAKSSVKILRRGIHFFDQCAAIDRGRDDVVRGQVLQPFWRNGSRIRHHGAIIECVDIGPAGHLRDLPPACCASSIAASVNTGSSQPGAAGAQFFAALSGSGKLSQPPPNALNKSAVAASCARCASTRFSWASSSARSVSRTSSRLEIPLS